MPDRLEIEFANARVSMSRIPELTREQRLRLGDYQVIMLGRPGWLVDYQDLAYRTDPAEIARAQEEILGDWLSDWGRLFQLARLSGIFMILVAWSDRLERLVTSDELPNTVYQRQEKGRLLLSDDPWPVIRRRALDLASYSPPDLAYYDRRKTCRPGRTLFPGLGRLQPATLYTLEQGRLEPRRESCLI